MTANNIEKSYNELKDKKQQNLEEAYLIIKESFNNLFNYIFSSTKTENVPQVSLRLIWEFVKIIQEEKKIINFLIKHISYINEEDLKEFLYELDELNEKTFNHFYNCLGDIEDAILLADSNRLITRKNFDYITENKELQTKACNIIFSKELIKEFLGYEDEFWTFIDARTIFQEDTDNFNLDWYYDSEKNDVIIKLYLPHIIDLKTALIAVKGYAKAHVLYFAKGKKTYNTNVEEAINKYHLKTKNYFNI